MAVDRPKSKIVVIDTGSYAGNFEREMCAFMTGQYGECGVGDDVAEEAKDVLQYLSWYDDFVTSEQDDNGCSRPASIWPSPGRFNDGYGGHYDDTPDARAALEPSRARANFPAYESVAVFVEQLPPAYILEEMVARAKLYCEENGIVYKGYRLLEPTFGVKEVSVVNGYRDAAAG